MHRTSNYLSSEKKSHRLFSNGVPAISHAISRISASVAGNLWYVQARHLCQRGGPGVSEKLWEELRRTFVEELREPGGTIASKYGT